jgi:hypothetical protein
MSELITQGAVLSAKQIENLHEIYEYFCWEATEAVKTGNRNTEAHFRFHARRVAMSLPRRLDQ